MSRPLQAADQAHREGPRPASVPAHRPLQKCCSHRAPPTTPASGHWFRLVHRGHTARQPSKAATHRRSEASPPATARRAPAPHHSHHPRRPARAATDCGAARSRPATAPHQHHHPRRHPTRRPLTEAESCPATAPHQCPAWPQFLAVDGHEAEIRPATGLCIQGPTKRPVGRRREPESSAAAAASHCRLSENLPAEALASVLHVRAQALGSGRVLTPASSRVSQTPNRTRINKGPIRAVSVSYALQLVPVLQLLVDGHVIERADGRRPSSANRRRFPAGRCPPFLQPPPPAL